jgi:hypothetical protein
VEEILRLTRLMKQKCKQVAGLKRAELFYNVAGMEVVSIDHLTGFAVLDELAQNALNNEIGLRLVKLGFGIASVEYLHEIDGLAALRDAYGAL